MSRPSAYLALSGCLVFLSGVLVWHQWMGTSQDSDEASPPQQTESQPGRTAIHPREVERSSDSPMWGGTPSRNLVSPVRDLPVDFLPGSLNQETGEINRASSHNLRWVTDLGRVAAIGGAPPPAIANGRVYIGTNNLALRDPKNVGDRGVLLCLDEQTGEFVWQLVVPKFPSRVAADWEYSGIQSTPAVEGKRLWVMTNRCEILCLDVNGLQDGNDGPFVEEDKYMTTEWMKKEGVGPDFNRPYADIIWKVDLRHELGVFFHSIARGSPLVWGNHLFLTTSNGVDWSHTNIPYPNAPAMVVMDKNSGKVLGDEYSGVSGRTLHANWSSPSMGSVKGEPVVFFGGGDGYVYGFDPIPVPAEDDPEFPVLRELWRCDANPPEYRTEGGVPDGEPIKYASFRSASEVIGSPVFDNDLVYVAIGQDAEHGDGVGMFSCIHAGFDDAKVDRAKWTYKDIGRSMSTASVANGLVFIAELNGDLHCLDAETGEVHWVHSTDELIMGSTLVADGKVHLGTESGELFIFEASSEKSLLTTIKFPNPIYTTPVAANGTLYVRTDSHLYAFENSSEAQ